MIKVIIIFSVQRKSISLSIPNQTHGARDTKQTNLISDMVNLNGRKGIEMGNCKKEIALTLLLNLRIQQMLSFQLYLSTNSSKNSFCNLEAGNIVEINMPR